MSLLHFVVYDFVEFICELDDGFFIERSLCGGNGGETDIETKTEARDNVWVFLRETSLS